MLGLFVVRPSPSKFIRFEYTAIWHASEIALSLSPFDSMVLLWLNCHHICKSSIAETLRQHSPTYHCALIQGDIIESVRSHELHMLPHSFTCKSICWRVRPDLLQAAVALLCSSSGNRNTA